METLWLIPCAPILAFLITGLLALTRRIERAAPYISVAATLISGAAALQSRPTGAESPPLSQSATWLTIPPNFQIALGVYLDPLAWGMTCVVVVVSALVQIYSIGYMRGENGYARYFAYMSLFTASMLGLVVADNLFQLYVCWELVGICSYLLIGFWWFKPSAANAAKKAFVVTRFGDVGFMLGVLLLASTAGSFGFSEVTRVVQEAASGASISIPLVSAQTFLWLAPLLLFCGAIGKSAQFPLHVWLPDAMEGPTPVSALIHAATMVAAGVYMVARLFAIFSVSAVALNVVLIIGAVTALIAATIALVQVDIKKVMAYSTVSQLGYMMLGLGAGGQVAAMFHLTTHAMFKALLFLSAGSVIHALHHSDDPNDLRKMGGLGGKMRHTALTCGIGVLALAGFPLLSGFWSKDAILDAALHSGAPAARFALAVGVLVAGITAFYSARMWLMAFWGAPRSEAAEHARESPLVMTLPLWLLAIPSLGLGYVLHHGGLFARFLGAEEVSPMQPVLAVLTTLIALAGMALAGRLYAKPQLQADPIERIPAYGFLANLWYLDAFWNIVGARGTLAVGRLAAWVDRNIVDRYVAHSAAWLCQRAGVALRRTSNGQTQSYATAMLAGIVVILALLVLYQSMVGAPQRALRSDTMVVWRRESE